LQGPSYAYDETDGTENDPDRDSPECPRWAGAGEMIEEETERRAPDDTRDEKPSEAEQIPPTKLKVGFVGHGDLVVVDWFFSRR